MPKTKQLILANFDQYQCDQEKTIGYSMVAFFINPPEGAEHSLKCAKSKIGQRFYFKIFSDPIVIKFGKMRLMCINKIVDNYFRITNIRRYKGR